jgi:hypothetical protein
MQHRTLYVCIVYAVLNRLIFFSEKIGKMESGGLTKVEKAYTAECSSISVHQGVTFPMKFGIFAPNFFTD